MLAQFIEQGDVALFDVVTLFPDIAGDVVRIEFQRIGARIRDLPGVSHPSARGHAVQARHHGDREARLE